MEVQEILSKVKEGTMSVEEAQRYLKRQPFEELGYAKLDTHRKIRSGFAEVIFCSGKADEHLRQIVGKLYEEEGEVFGTRASKEQYEMLKKTYPELEYDEISGIIKIEKKGEKTGRKDRCMYRGNCRYISGGRSGADGRIFRLQSRKNL